MSSFVVPKGTPIYHGSPYGGVAIRVTIQDTSPTGNGPPEIYNRGPYGQMLNNEQRLPDVSISR